ncbi:MAG TPA: tetratricopeptide repeat protein [Vicinamibacterales bacterium]|nr:tetratricopeptide repeat protein [Vicinamibacterales bacterium]
MRSRVFITLYLVSGAAALLYEVAWLRLLTMTMGHTTGAVGAVLAAFMGGLAMGAWIAGRFTDGLERLRALRVYAALEGVIALCALAMPFAIGAMRPLLAWAYADGAGGALFDVTRLAASIALIALPGAAMGASFPVGACVVSAVGAKGARGAKGASGATGANGAREVAELYAANTVGAAIGAGLTGFVLLPSLGLFGTTFFGVVLNLVAAAGALVLSRTQEPKNLKEPTEPTTEPTERDPLNLMNPMNPMNPRIIGVIAASGFVALVYEVVWTRVLAMTLGPTTYAFSAMLVAFIAGLAIGAAIASAMLPRARRQAMWLGLSIIMAAAAALAAGMAADRLPIVIARTAGRTDASFMSVFALDVVLAVAIQLPMTIALGAALPFAIAAASASRDTAPRTAAVIYASNTAGAIAGALAGSFILIPRLGLQHSLQLASGIAVVAGLAACLAQPEDAARLTRRGQRSRFAIGAAAIAVFVLAALMPAWNHGRLANGAYRLAPALAAGDIETALEAGDLLYYREGAAGTVSVRRLLGVTSLAIDGKVDASNGADMLTQKLLAHLPLLLHDNPRSVYIIGLGSGVTLGAALRHPIDRADVSEISPEVVSASAHFSTENRDALSDGRVRLIVGDGRSHLLLSDDRYDVIVSEPSNPWMAGVSTLFTREFFQAARAHLQPGGILCQWAHTYNINDADLRSIVDTFLSTFPDGSAWLVGASDLLLIGSTSPIRALESGIGAAWNRPGVADDLAQVAVSDAFGVLTLFIARGRDLQSYAAGARVQTDDRLALEYSAPRAIYGRYQSSNIDRLRATGADAAAPAAIARVRAFADAASWRNRAAMEIKADAPELAFQDYREALTIAPQDLDALERYVGAAAASGQLDAAEQYLRSRIAMTDTAALNVELSRVLAARGDLDGAAAAAQHGAALDPSSERALDQLVTVLADNRNDAAIEQLVTLLVRTGATRPVTLYAQMRLAHMRGRFAQTRAFGERLTSTETSEENGARNANLLGLAYDGLGDHDRARQMFEASLRTAPRAPAVLMNLGFTELKAGRPDAAEKRFSEALFLSPTLAPALDGLAQALDRQGKTSRASAVRAIRR